MISAPRHIALKAAGESVLSRTAVIPSVSALMTPCSRSGMRLSALEAVAGVAEVAEALPPPARRSRVLVGGAVGDAVAVELLETLSLAGGAILFCTFAGGFCHDVSLPGMWLPPLVRLTRRKG